MIETFSRNKLIIFVLVLLIATGLWYSLSGGNSEEPLLVTEDFTTPTSEADRDIVATLIELRSVSLDGTIFSDPIFRSLTDFGSEIIQEPVGRVNPFAPLSGGTTSATLAPLRP